MQAGNSQTTVGPQQGSIAVGHPVDVASGAFFSSWSEVGLGGPLMLRVERTYNTALLGARRRWHPFGPGWAVSFDERIHPTIEGLVHVDPLGRETAFDRGDVARIGSPGARLTTTAGGVEIETVDEHTLRLIRFGENRARKTHLFRRLATGSDYSLVAIERSPGHRIELARDRAGRTQRIAHVRSGRGVRISYDGADRIAAIHLSNERNPDGVLLSRFSYEDGMLIAVSDDRGVRERFEYDAAGRMISELRRNGAVNRMRYDRDGRCIHVVGADGFQERRLAYRTAERITEVTDSHGHTTSYRANASGQVLEVKLPLDETVRFTYDPLGRMTDQTLPNGQHYGYAYDPRGHLVSVALPDGRVVKREHDAHHRLVAAVDGDRRTELGYDVHHNLTSVHLPGGAVWKFVYDAQGNCVETVDPTGARTTMLYDRLGDCVGETSGKGALTRFAHDEWGQVAEEINPFGHRRRYEYDRYLRLVLCTDAEGRTWRFEPSPEGNRLVRHDATGRWEYRYNACGKVTEIVDPQNLRTTYTWDSEPNRLLAVESPTGDRYQFSYDALGRTVARTAWDGSVTAFEWAGGALAAEVDPLGQRTEYKYDDAGRLSDRAGPTDSLHYAYGADGRLAVAVENGIELALEYDPSGRITAERQDGIELRRRYDAKGRLVWLGSDLQDNLLYEWDADDRCTAVNRAGASMRFTRDAVGREQVRHVAGGGELSFAYTPSGAMASQKYLPPPPSGPPGAPTGTGFGSGTRAREASAPPPDPVPIERAYTYDAANRLGTISDSLRGDTHLRHDCYGRLVAMAAHGEPPILTTHDPAGNRLFEATLAPGAPLANVFGASIGAVNPMGSVRAEQVELTGRYVRERGNRLVRIERRGQTITYTYDAAGFVIAKAVILADGAREEWRFTWNSHGRLVALTRPDGHVWRYEYDAAGRRVRKRGPDGEDIRYVWQGTQVLYVLRDGVRQSTWLNEPGTGVPLLWEDQQQRAHVILTNSMGTPMEVVDVNGSLEWTNRSRAWGDATPPSEAPPKQLLGHWHDEESGLNYNFYRYYDPDLGRYISPDPIGIRGGLNEYVGITSPYFGIDPLGLASSRNPGPFGLAPQGANPSTDPPAPGGTAYPSKMGRSYRVGTPDEPRGDPIPLSSATAAEAQTSDGPHLVAFNGTNDGAIAPVDGAHHADQVLMQHLVDNAGEIPGEGPIVVLIRGRDICPACAAAIDGENGLGQQLADASGRQVLVLEDDEPQRPPRNFTPETPCE